MTFAKITELAISEILELEEITLETVHAMVNEYSFRYELCNHDISKLHRNLMNFEG